MGDFKGNNLSFKLRIALFIIDKYKFHRNNSKYLICSRIFANIIS